jgi:TatD DNase family protein
VIHSRDSFPQLYDILSDYRESALRGIFHCFSGSTEEASALMRFDGFMFGIGGVLTYRKSVLPSVLPLIPLDRVVLETDCPYLPPVPFRGKRNEPSYIVNTANMMAQVYGITFEELADVTSRNACRLFGL